MKDVKKLLVLGGTSASTNLIEEAHEMGGVYVIVTDNLPRDVGIAKALADEVIQIDTTDIEGLAAYIKDNDISGVFCGPSEFNLVNVMNVCERAGLPCYCTKEQWEICSNKAKFKDLCRAFHVPCVPEFDLTPELKREDLDKIQYPVVIKPVDSYSSNGLYVCWNEKELTDAVPKSASVSKSGKIIVEKYITNDCGFGCRYIANNGEIYLSAAEDRYTVDTAGGKALISSTTFFPSRKLDEYVRDINSNVISMFKSIGIRNGTMFLQALVDEDDKIYFHEMGLRLSGGLIFSILKAACGYSDMKMMIRYALGGVMATPDEIAKIDPYMHGHTMGVLSIPLKSGTIGKIEGIDEILSNPAVIDYIQYYYEGDSVSERAMGTLGQHFCRVKLMINSLDELKDMIHWIQSVVRIWNTSGENMIYKQFDTDRIR